MGITQVIFTQIIVTSLFIICNALPAILELLYILLTNIENTLGSIFAMDPTELGRLITTSTQNPVVPTVDTDNLIPHTPDNQPVNTDEASSEEGEEEEEEGEEVENDEILDVYYSELELMGRDPAEYDRFLAERYEEVYGEMAEYGEYDDEEDYEEGDNPSQNIPVNPSVSTSAEPQTSSIVVENEALIKALDEAELNASLDQYDELCIDADNGVDDDGTEPSEYYASNVSPVTEDMLLNSSSEPEDTRPENSQRLLYMEEDGSVRATSSQLGDTDTESVSGDTGESNAPSSFIGSILSSIVSVVSKFVVFWYNLPQPNSNAQTSTVSDSTHPSSDDESDASEAAPKTSAGHTQSASMQDRRIFAQDAFNDLEEQFKASVSEEELFIDHSNLMRSCFANLMEVALGETSAFKTSQLTGVIPENTLTWNQFVFHYSQAFMQLANDHLSRCEEDQLFKSPSEIEEEQRVRLRKLHKAYAYLIGKPQDYTINLLRQRDPYKIGNHAFMLALTDFHAVIKSFQIDTFMEGLSRVSPHFYETQVWPDIVSFYNKCVFEHADIVLKSKQKQSLFNFSFTKVSQMKAKHSALRPSAYANFLRYFFDNKRHPNTLFDIVTSIGEISNLWKYSPAGFYDRRAQIIVESLLVGRKFKTTPSSNRIIGVETCLMEEEILLREFTKRLWHGLLDIQEKPDIQYYQQVGYPIGDDPVEYAATIENFIINPILTNPYKALLLIKYFDKSHPGTVSKTGFEFFGLPASYLHDYLKRKKQQ